MLGKDASRPIDSILDRRINATYVLDLRTKRPPVQSALPVFKRVIDAGLGDVEGAGGAGDFTTCNRGEGSPAGVNQYDANFQGGAPFRDVLTRPAELITRGDYVSEVAFQWNNVFDQPELMIDFKVEQ